jgi:hypothetical protein
MSLAIISEMLRFASSKSFSISWSFLCRISPMSRRSKPSTAESRKTWRAGPGMFDSLPWTVASQPGCAASPLPFSGIEPHRRHSVWYSAIFGVLAEWRIEGSAMRLSRTAAT